MSPQSENTWSALSYLSVSANIVTRFLGPVAALIIWFVYKDRSSKVAFHAPQSLWNQVAWLVVLSIGRIITALLTMFLVGLLLILVMLLLMLVPLSKGRGPPTE